jgi:hypothetical protein
MQKRILRVYNKIFQSWNNECIQYKAGGVRQFYGKAYSKGLYNNIFQSWNNECTEYKVEHGGK